MPLLRVLISACSAALLATLNSTAESVALRPNKATDESVCDLSHNTNGFIGGSVLIPAGAPYKDKLDVYFRLAATFVAVRCANGQMLILQGSSIVAVDRPSLTELANAACAGSTVTRTEISVPSITPGESEAAFELRCVISKREELAAKLGHLEQADPMSVLKARLQAAGMEPAAGTPSSNGAARENKDCDKVTLASLLQGGACKK